MATLKEELISFLEKSARNAPLQTKKEINEVTKKLQEREIIIPPTAQKEVTLLVGNIFVWQPILRTESNKGLLEEFTQDYLQDNKPKSPSPKKSI